MEMHDHDTTKIILDEEPELEDPLFIEGLTGIGHIGRTAVHYLIDQFDATQFGEILSHHFPHWTIVDEDQQLDILKNELYYIKRDDGRDLVLLMGDAQSIDPEGHYTIAYAIVDLLEQLGVEEMITLGGYGTGETIEGTPEVYGVVTEKGLKETYDEYDVSFDHDVGQIIGASGLLLGIGERYDMEGICLLGETPGFLLSDPKATEEVLKVIEDMLDLEIDYTNLEEKIEEAEKVIKKIRDLQQQVKEQQSSSGGDKGGDELGYIG